MALAIAVIPFMSAGAVPSDNYNVYVYPAFEVPDDYIFECNVEKSYYVSIEKTYGHNGYNFRQVRVCGTLIDTSNFGYAPSVYRGFYWPAYNAQEVVDWMINEGVSVRSNMGDFEIPAENIFNYAYEDLSVCQTPEPQPQPIPVPLKPAKTAIF